VEQIRAAFSGWVPGIHVAAHPGKFSEEEVRRQAQKTPAILTSFLRSRDAEGSDSITFVSWVLYRATAQDKLYDGGLQIVSSLIPVLKKIAFPFGIKETVIDAECLYSGSLDAINITLWGVKWEERLSDSPLSESGYFRAGSF